MSVAESRFTTYENDPETVDHAVAHLVALVNADSTSGREEPAVAVAEQICADLGLATTRMTAAPGRDNLLVGAKDARVVLCTHLDTVPPFIPASVDATHIHGRGACDAKGVAIAMLYALKALREAGHDAHSAACLLVVGEETDHLGAKTAVSVGLSPTHVILGEPCGMAPAIAQKGLLKLILSARGAAGHSAYPDAGVSAVHLLLDAIAGIRSAPLPADPILGETTLNVGRIEGGVAANVLAPSAEATLLIRCAAPVESVLAAVVDAAGDRVSIRETGRAEPLDFDTAGEAPGPAVPFNTDGFVLGGLGAALQLMGPGDMRCAHAPHERLSIAELGGAITDFARAVTRLL